VTSLSQQVLSLNLAMDYFFFLFLLYMHLRASIILDGFEEQRAMSHELGPKPAGGNMRWAGQETLAGPEACERVRDRNIFAGRSWTPRHPGR